MRHINALPLNAARIRRQSGLLALVCGLSLVVSTSAYGEHRAAEHKVQPVYPAAARMLHIQGVIKVDATVNADGVVTKVAAEGGNKLLAQAAEDAVKKWKFAPGAAETVEEVDVVFKDDE